MKRLRSRPLGDRRPKNKIPQRSERKSKVSRYCEYCEYMCTCVPFSQSGRSAEKDLLVTVIEIGVSKGLGTLEPMGYSAGC